MATIQTDLQDLTLAESYSGDTSGVGGTWTIIGGAGGTGAGAGVDYAMQGTNAIDAKINSTEKGPAITLNSAQTLGTGEHIFVWGLCATVGIADLLQNRGVSVVLGTGTNNNYVQYHVNGSDTLNATQRLGQCYPINYAVRTANTGSAPYRTVTGSPGANPTVMGMVYNITSSSKGNNVATDAIRRGYGLYITAGTQGAPATFSEVATFNDNSTNRFGIFSSAGGSSYLQQGYFVIGQNSSGTATQAYFEDSGKAITFLDTPHTTADFSRVVIDQSSTTANFTSCSWAAEGTTNKGRFIVEAANPTVLLDGCTFSAIAITTLRSNSTASNTVWSACEEVTQNGATITGCTFRDSAGTAALIADTETSITDCTFDSDGTGYGLEGFSAAGNYNISSNTFTNYGASGTANAALHILATSGTVNIECADSATTFTSEGAVVNITAGQVTTTITVRDVTTQAAVQGARVYVKAAAGGPLAVDTVIINGLTNASGQVTDQRSLASNQPVTGYARKGTSSPLYKNSPFSGTIDNGTGLSITTLMIPDE